MSATFRFLIVIILWPLLSLKVEGAASAVEDSDIADEDPSIPRSIRVSAQFCDPALKDLLGENQKIVFFLGDKRIGDISQSDLIPDSRISINDFVVVPEDTLHLNFSCCLEERIDDRDVFRMAPTTFLLTSFKTETKEGKTQFLEALRINLCAEGGLIRIGACLPKLVLEGNKSLPESQFVKHL